MAHTAVRVAAGTALAIALVLLCTPAAQAAGRAGLGSATAGPLSLDNLLSLDFVAPTVQDARRQVVGLTSGLAPAGAGHVGLGRLIS
ncbi:hypothetical protein SAMN06272735_8613 [Streptomyces sp. TLI_55]|uniref:hypothetical protein n=1 Tax=Streptomyces sp. TLI_55 TaxID=1938861 RepID=UPI000BC56217|nr:hypothetical protein [Streptomyces sp. TLI_55]SNX88176.1 hypothetical protein SAMN06272735_8613 [Streptomyces sp. TLI_55]